MRGNAKRILGDFDGAIKDYSQVIKINPKDSDAFLIVPMLEKILVM